MKRIADFRLPIANWGEAELKRHLAHTLAGVVEERHVVESAIGNRKSEIIKWNH